jgi:ABC-type Fe3+ transport system substrate-binding protein
LGRAPSAFGEVARLAIISPHVEAIRVEFGEGFARWHESQFGVAAQVDWRTVGGSSDCLRFALSEFGAKSEGIGLDCFFGGGHEPCLVLAEKGLCLPYQPPAEILEGIPQQVNGIEVFDPGYRWFGAALSSFGILQNRLVQRRVGLPFVDRWDELAQPQVRGWVGAGDPRNSGTMNVMFEAFLQAYGWERGWKLLTQIAGNAREFNRVSSSTAKDVTLGETAYAFSIDFYGFAQVAAAGGSNLTFVLPQDFAPISPDGLAILKGGPHPDTARRFVDFVLSEAGQKLWFLPKGHPEGPRQFSIERMSVRPEFYQRYRGVSNIEFSPFDLKQSFRYDSKLARDRREVIAALVGSLFIDSLSELQSAWRMLDRKRYPADRLTEFGSVPISEAEALRLAARDWKDPELRSRKKIEWQSWAQQKYRRLSAQ